MAYVRASEREVQLLDAAKRILVRDGYKALSLRSVAAEAGVRLSTLQYIFRTRTDLMRALSAKVLAESAWTTHEPGDGGLAVELTRILDWYGSRVLIDPGMTELLRAEFKANISRHPTSWDEYPAGRPLLGGLMLPWLTQAAELANESYALPLERIAALCVLILTGLTYEYMRSGDLERFLADAVFFFEQTVRVADPRPASD